MPTRSVYRLLFVIGLAIIIVVIISWLAFPAWRSEKGGVFELIGLAIGGVLVAAEKIVSIAKTWSEISKGKEEAPIAAITPQQLRDNMGRGGRVNWVDRRATSVLAVREHGCIVITGPMKHGKTREAIELIQRLVADGLVPGARIYEPVALRFFDRGGIRDAVQRCLSPKEPALLFIDDLPYHYYGELLERLDDVIQSMRICIDCFVIATARSDQLTEEHQRWFRKHRFHVVSLPPILNDQLGRVIDSAAGVFNLQVTDEARQVFIAYNDGSPELPILAFGRLSDQGTIAVDKNQAQQAAHESLAEAWADRRRKNIYSKPGTEALLQALGCFYSARVPLIYPLVLSYASAWWQQNGAPKLPWQRARLLNEARQFLLNFDIVIQPSRLSVPDIAISGLLEPSRASQQLEDFLIYQSHSLINRVHRRFKPGKNNTGIGFFYLALDANFSNDNKRAITLYTQAIQLDPNMAQAYSNRGLTYHTLKDYPAALTDYNQAIKLDPNNAKAYNNRGLTNAALKNYPAALADYNQAIQLDLNLAMAYNNRGNTYGDLKNYPAALADYNKAIQLDPNYAMAYYNRGSTYHDLQDYPAALADYNIAIQLDPNDAAAYSNRGLTYHTLQDYPAALADYNKAIQLNPNFAQAYSNRGLTYAELKNYPAALADYNQAIQLDPNFAQAYSNRGLTYAALQEYPAALADYNQAIQLDPNDASPVYNTACLYALQQDIEQAGTWLRRAIRMNPKYLEMARTDADFDAIRDNPAFQALLQEFPDTDLPGG